MAWIVFCAALFAGVRGADDPALPRDRITEREAVSAASAALHARTGAETWELVHAAYSPAGELRETGLWVVLFVPRTGAGWANSVVVEVNGRDGAFVRARRPVPRIAGR